MYYVGTLFISKFPFAFEEQRIINGREQTCLVIPCEAGQMERTRYGAWFCRLIYRLMPPNPQQRLARIALGFKNMEEVEKSKNLGYYETSENLGYLFVADETGNEAKLDKTNKMTNLYCEGRLFLDSIDREDVKTDPRTGRKYVDFTFRKSRFLDAFGNSHEIVVRSDYGEHQIGVARQIDIEPSPGYSGLANKRDERTVEQRCTLSKDRGSKAQKTETLKTETSKPSSPYDNYEW